MLDSSHTPPPKLISFFFNKYIYFQIRSLVLRQVPALSSTSNRTRVSSNLKTKAHQTVKKKKSII